MAALATAIIIDGKIFCSRAGGSLSLMQSMIVLGSMVLIGIILVFMLSRLKI